MMQRQRERYGEVLVLVGTGGFLGANLRYASGAIAGEGLAVTVVVNAIGSFGLGLLLFDARARMFLSKRMRYLFGTGFFASFTTYSTFVADIALSTPTIALGYLFVSYLTGFAGVLASKRVLESWYGSGGEP